MKNKKLISAILAAASIAGGVVGAQAADASTLEAKVDSYTSRVQQAEKDIKGLQTKVDALDTTGIADNKAGIEANKNAIATQGAQISQLQKDMAQEGMDRVNEMNKLTAKVDQKADKGDVKQNKNDIASNAAAIQKETQKREEAVKGLQDKLTVVNGQIENEKTTRENADKTLRDNIEKETADRIAGDNALNSRINQVESDANKGIAKASALAALHPLDYDPDNKFDIAAAGGFYKGENAFALGAFYRPNRNVMLSMGTTLTSGDNAYNVGVTFKIGKSGKHTEAGLTTADLYAMIGAMQDKMDQQQKKIEELEAKQAK